MIEVERQEIIACDPQSWLSLVWDVERYAEVDDKLGAIRWIRRDGDVLEFKFRARLPGLPGPAPSVVSRMRRTPGRRIDVELAPLPRNLTGRLASVFRASFRAEAHERGAVVVRSISFDFRPPLRWVVEPVLRRTLPASVERELRLAKAILERPLTA